MPIAPYRMSEEVTVKRAERRTWDGIGRFVKKKLYLQARNARKSFKPITAGI